MTTAKQTSANRRNAKSSTGPKTAAGKETSSKNALTHGLTARKVPFLPSEDEHEYNQFRQALLENLAPVGALEEQVATEIIDLSWRLRRASRLEQGILTHGVATIDEHWFTAQRRRFEITNADVLTDPFSPLDDVVAVTNRDLHEFCDQNIDEAIALKRLDETRVAKAFIDDAAAPNAISKLTRYEASLFRRRNEALALYARLQQASMRASEAPSSASTQ